MKGPALKERLCSNRPVIGTFVSEVRNPLIARMLATAGMDFFILDGEHGNSHYETMAAMCAVAREAGIACLVRIPEIRRETVLKPLDAGAEGLVVPQVETPEQVRELVQHAKYPPLGRRGAVLRRAHTGYMKVDAASYLQQANETTVLIIQVESPEAAANLEAMLSPGVVDVVFVGPFDLSVAMGIPGQVNHPDLRQLVEQVIVVCQRHGVAVGIHQGDLEGARYWLEKGVRFLVYSGDAAMIVDSAQSAVNALREGSG